MKSAFDFSLNTDGVSTSVKTDGTGIGTSGFSSMGSMGGMGNIPGFDMFNSTFGKLFSNDFGHSEKITVFKTE